MSPSDVWCDYSNHSKGHNHPGWLIHYDVLSCHYYFFPRHHYWCLW
jgi:hypothetical protein